MRGVADRRNQPDLTINEETNMMITVLYGTESGNAELVAEDVAQSLRDSGLAVDLASMEHYSLAELDASRHYLLVCSTHGEGELPTGAKPLMDALAQHAPDLSGVRFAAFGLGDRSYEHYSRGVDLVAAQWTALGAQCIADIGRHDASSRDLPSDLAIPWAQRVCASLAAVSAL